MTTIRPAMPLALQLADMGVRQVKAAMRIPAAAFQRNQRRGRPVHELSDWVLRDIGLEREDTMSPEARRAVNRLQGLAFW